MSLDVAPGPVSGAGPHVADATDATDATDAATVAVEAPAHEPVPWGTVVALAALVTAVDVFVVVSLQGAIGSIERAQHGFELWLGWCAVLLPVYVLVVVVSLRRSRRRFGPSLRTPRPVLRAGLAVAVATTLVGACALAANAAWDYRYQTSAIGSVAGLHDHVAGTSTAPLPGRNDAQCRAACRARRATLHAHARGLALATPVMAGANLLAVAWVVALAGGSLDARRRRTA